MRRVYEQYIKRWMPYLPFLLFLLYSLAIHADASMKAYDDHVYKMAWVDTSVWEWCKSFYLGWSGRVPLQALDIVFLQLPIWVWRIWNACLFAVCPFLLSRIGELLYDKKDSRVLCLSNSFVCLLFLLLPADSVDGAVLWISGSFNYLLPCFGLLLALYPFWAILYGKKASKRSYVMAGIGVFLCCFAEQTAAIFLCLVAIILVYVLAAAEVTRKGKRMALFESGSVDCLGNEGARRVPWGNWYLLGFGIVNAAILFLAPGNHVRYVSEVPLWVKTYDMYSFVDKLILGYVHCIRMMFLNGWFFILLIVGLLFFVLRKRSLVYKGLYALYVLFTCGMLVLVYRIENESFVFLVGNLNSMLYLFLILAWLVLLAILLFTAYEEEPKTGLMLAFLVLGAFAAGAVVGMSPSVFESGLRVFFVPYVMLIFVITLELQQALLCRVTDGKNL